MARARVDFTPLDRLIARNLREARLRAGKTQADVAAWIGLGWTDMTVSKIENLDGANPRHVRASELFRLAELYGVPVGSLFDDGDGKEVGRGDAPDSITSRP